MTMVKATARKWTGGWEIWLDDDNLTSVRHLRNVTQQVRDYLDTVEPDVDHSDVELDLDLDIGAMKDEIARVRRETREAAEAQAQAAYHTRKVVKTLRAEGYTMDDAADILGVSKGRISQLVSSCAAGGAACAVGAARLCRLLPCSCYFCSPRRTLTHGLLRWSRPD